MSKVIPSLLMIILMLSLPAATQSSRLTERFDNEVVVENVMISSIKQISEDFKKVYPWSTTFIWESHTCGILLIHQSMFRSNSGGQWELGKHGGVG